MRDISTESVCVHDQKSDLRWRGTQCTSGFTKGSHFRPCGPAARAKWEDITPLARNEWICWVISVKKPETRRQHIERVRTELKEGMRRPCCWPGCPHR